MAQPVQTDFTPTPTVKTVSVAAVAQVATQKDAYLAAEDCSYQPTPAFLINPADWAILPIQSQTPAIVNYNF